MRSRWLSSLVLLGLLAVPALAQNKDSKPEANPKTPAPTLVVRLAPVEELLADVKYLADFTEFGDTVKQVAGLVEGQAGAKTGLRGIDLKKPLGFYAYLKENIPESQVVAMIPIVNEEAFLEALNGFGLKTEKDKKDVYTVQLPQSPVPALFRFANGYCYLTALSDEALAKDKLGNPAQLLPAGQGLASISFRIDQIPDGFKQIVLGQIDLQLTDALDKVTGEQTEVQKAFAKQMLTQVADLIKSVVTNGNEVVVMLDVDAKKEKLAVEVTLDGKPDSKLSALLAGLGKAESLFGNFGGGDSAVQVLLNLALPKDLIKSFGAVIDESIAQTLKNEADPKRKAQAEKVLKALEPTLKAGELDMAVDLRRAKDAKFYTIVIGQKLKDGPALEKTFKELIKELPADDQKRIKMDAAEANGVKIHSIDVQGLDENAKKMFGDGPAFFAVRQDALVAVAGENALSTLKEVLAAKPKTSPQAHVTVGLTALAPAMANAPQADKEAVEKAVKEAFGKTKDADKITFTMESGKAMKIRFEMGAPAIKFFDLMRQAQMK